MKRNGNQYESYRGLKERERIPSQQITIMRFCTFGLEHTLYYVKYADEVPTEWRLLPKKQWNSEQAFPFFSSFLCGYDLACCWDKSTTLLFFLNLASSLFCQSFKTLWDSRGVGWVLHFNTKGTCFTKRAQLVKIKNYITGDLVSRCMATLKVVWKVWFRSCLPGCGFAFWQRRSASKPNRRYVFKSGKGQ